MAQDRFMVRAAVYLLLIRDDKVLLLRRFNTGWSDGMYTLPAGHLDGNEPLTVAMSREAHEETGVTIKPENLTFVHAMHRQSDREYLDFFFIAHEWEGEPVNTEPEKCDEVQWFPLGALPENILPYVRQVVDGYRTGAVFSETGW